MAMAGIHTIIAIQLFVIPSVISTRGYNNEGSAWDTLGKVVGAFFLLIILMVVSTIISISVGTGCCCGCRRWNRLSKGVKAMVFYSLIVDVACVIVFIIMVKINTAREERDERDEGV